MVFRSIPPQSLNGKPPLGAPLRAGLSGSKCRTLSSWLTSKTVEINHAELNFHTFQLSTFIVDILRCIWKIPLNIDMFMFIGVVHPFRKLLGMSLHPKTTRIFTNWIESFGSWRSALQNPLGVQTASSESRHDESGRVEFIWLHQILTHFIHGILILIKTYMLGLWIHVNPLDRMRFPIWESSFDWFHVSWEAIWWIQCL